MKSIKKFFDVQMGKGVCPPAREKLFKKLLPKLCVENDICPLCGEDLEVFDDHSFTFVNSAKRCVGCNGTFKGVKSYGRVNVESKAVIQS